MGVIASDGCLTSSKNTIEERNKRRRGEGGTRDDTQVQPLPTPSQLHSLRRIISPSTGARAFRIDDGEGLGGTYTMQKSIQLRGYTSVREKNKERNGCILVW